MNKRVLVVGAGNLGRRHIQSLELSQTKLDIVVVDLSEEALSIAKELLAKDAITNQISYTNSIASIDGMIDLAIVATTANSRLAILKELLSQGVNEIILEKIVFNSLSDINDAHDLISANREAKIWVNCPRRLYPIYRRLKKELMGETFEKFTVKGNNFGMGCNGIHFIDLIAYFIGDNNYQLSSERIVEVPESKRKGYVELVGALDGAFDSGCQVEMLCGNEGDKVELELCFILGHGSLLINEQAGEAILRRGDSMEVMEFNMPYQSELTGPLVDRIFSDSRCELTTLEESLALHYPFISAAYEAYAERFGTNDKKFIPLT